MERINAKGISFSGFEISTALIKAASNPVNANIKTTIDNDKSEIVGVELLKWSKSKSIKNKPTRIKRLRGINY